MAVLPIHLYGRSILRKKAKPVPAADAGLVRLAEDMVETMRNANGIGLAANQVGILHRILVVDVGETSEELRGLQPLVMVNPVLLREEGVWSMEEGCLSIPEIRDEVERAEEITVRYKNLAFEDREITVEGLLGRVILHEIDHLDGVLFLDYLGTVKQKLLKGRLNKIRKGEVDTNYPIVTAEGIMEEQKSNIKGQE